MKQVGQGSLQGHLTLSAARDLSGLRVRCPDSLAVLRRPLAQVTRLCGLRRTAPDVCELQLKLQRGARLAQASETNSTPQFPA